MCFIETLVIAHTFSEILAPIDHKGSNWTFHILGQDWLHTVVLLI